MTYPANILSADEKVIKDQCEIEFTDPDNQPAQPNEAFQTPAEGSVAVVKDAAGDPIYTAFDDNNPTNLFTGFIDASGLGPSIQYVTVQAGPPSAYVGTPLVYDNTAVTGGLYAWDSSAYVKIGNLVA